MANCFFQIEDTRRCKCFSVQMVALQLQTSKHYCHLSETREFRHELKVSRIHFMRGTTCRKGGMEKVLVGKAPCPGREVMGREERGWGFNGRREDVSKGGLGGGKRWHRWRERGGGGTRFKVHIFLCSGTYKYTSPALQCWQLADNTNISGVYGTIGCPIYVLLVW